MNLSNISKNNVINLKSALAALGVISILVFAINASPLGRIIIDAFINLDGNMHIHLPNFELISKQSIQVKFHLYSVLIAVLITFYQYLAPKGKLPHKVFGYLWLSFMALTAVTSLFIKELNHVSFSLIHALSILVLIRVPYVIYYARTKQIAKHKKAVNGLVFGGMLIAGIFTFLPGRLMWQVFFG